MVKNSSFFKEIADRYHSFSYETLSTLSYTDVIVNFNPNLVNSKLLSDYILFEKDEKNEYNYMAIAYDYNNNQRYFESFFHNINDSYLNGQKVVKIVKYELVNANNEIIFYDEF